MFAKLEAILLEDEEQQMNFPFQAMDYPVEDNNQYLLFGWSMDLISDKYIQIGIGVTIILIVIVMGIMYIQRRG